MLHAFAHIQPTKANLFLDEVRNVSVAYVVADELLGRTAARRANEELLFAARDRQTSNTMHRLAALDARQLRGAARRKCRIDRLFRSHTYLPSDDAGGSAVSLSHRRLRIEPKPVMSSTCARSRKESN